ncbi:MAG: recombinase family protein, partial [Planctomycetes bacterium]|nr:recombinase family protein [Planctomycetota bacterium]
MTTNVTNVAAIYARFSSELQDDSSIDSQVEKCRQFAEANGLTVPADLVFTDSAMSGRNRERAAYQEMIIAAKDDPPRFSTVLVWKFSRLARNREESILVKGLLRKRGIVVRSVSEPVDPESAHGKLMEGILECLDEFYSANLAAETRRGQEQANSEGFWTGGRPPYGYKLKKIADPKGRTGKGGHVIQRTVLEVDPLRARVVKDIFTWSSQGMGLRKIAERLNDAAVPTPDSGRGFDPSTIRGIIHNETYTGCLIYNRQQFFRKNDGTKTKRNNPRSEWKIKKMPDLRIITDDLWRAVADRLGKRKKNKASTAHRNIRYPFAGIIKCADCGATYMAIKTSRKGHTYVNYACSYNRRRGSSICANSTKVDQDTLMDAVMKAIEENILDEASVAIITEAIEKLVTEHRGSHAADRKRLEKELKKLDKEIEKLSRAMTIATDVPELAKQLQEKAKRRTSVADALDGINSLVKKDLLVGLEDRVRAEMEDIRGLLASQDVHQFRHELMHHVSAILVDAQGQMRIEGSLVGALDSVLKLVAGA